jgi:tetratricopeptide (TPR) repeat protein
VRFALILSVALGAGAVCVGAVLGARHFARSHECRPSTARRLGAWNTAMRGRVKAALGGVPWTANVLDGFDTASATWERSYRAVCTAGGPHRDARMHCLDRSIDRIRELASSLGGSPDGLAMAETTAARPAGLDESTRLAAPAAVAALPGAAFCETTTEADDRTRPLEDPQAAILVAARALVGGDLANAERTILAARARALDRFGAHHPELATYDDVLADVDRAHGKLRAALALHDQSEQLRAAAFGAEDRSIATSLHHRALTLLEGGELGSAEHALHRALALRTKALGETSRELGELYVALALCDVARGDRDSASEHTAIAEKLDPAGGDKSSGASGAEAVALTDASPAMLVEIATTRFAAGDHATPADLFATALAKLSNEPNRTALAAALGLAQCDDARAGQAARTAVQLYLAMPELDRAMLALARELAKRP